jgi:hypothetical protein
MPLLKNIEKTIALESNISNQNEIIKNKGNKLINDNEKIKLLFQIKKQLILKLIIVKKLPHLLLIF